MRLIDADAIHYHQMWEEDWTKQTIYFGHGVPEWEIDEMPTVDAEPVRHSKWVIKNNFDEKVNRNYQHVLCSECKTCVAHDWESKLRTALNYKYCPTCGAKIDEECDDETN